MPILFQPCLKNPKEKDRKYPSPSFKKKNHKKGKKDLQRLLETHNNDHASLSDEPCFPEVSAGEGSSSSFLASGLGFSASLDKAAESEWLSCDESCTSDLSGPWSCFSVSELLFSAAGSSPSETVVESERPGGGVILT